MPSFKERGGATGGAAGPAEIHFRIRALHRRGRSTIHGQSGNRSIDLFSSLPLDSGREEQLCARASPRVSPRCFTSSPRFIVPVLVRRQLEPPLVNFNRGLIEYSSRAEPNSLLT